jgi:hypothetical protein
MALGVLGGDDLRLPGPGTFVVEALETPRDAGSFARGAVKATRTKATWYIADDTLRQHVAMTLRLDPGTCVRGGLAANPIRPDQPVLGCVPRVPGPWTTEALRECGCDFYSLTKQASACTVMAWTWTRPVVTDRAAVRGPGTYTLVDMSWGMVRDALAERDAVTVVSTNGSTTELLEAVGVRVEAAPTIPTDASVCIVLSRDTAGDVQCRVMKYFPK